MTFAETVEEGARRCKKIFFWIAGLVFLVTVMVTLELAFIFSVASIAQFISHAGGDLSALIIIVKIHSFALQFTLVMVVFGIFALAMNKILKYMREAREKGFAQWQEARRQAIGEIAERVKEELRTEVKDIQIDYVDLTGLAKPARKRRRR